MDTKQEQQVQGPVGLSILVMGERNRLEGVVVVLSSSLVDYPYPSSPFYSR